MFRLDRDRVWGSEFGDAGVAAETRSDVLFDDGIEVAGVGHLDPLHNVFEDVRVVLVANHATHPLLDKCACARTL